MQARLFPVTPPADLERGQADATGEGLEYRANKWIVGALTLFLMMTFFPTTSLVVFLIFVISVSGCIRLGLRLGQHQLMPSSLSDGLGHRGMRELWNGQRIIGIPRPADVSHLQLLLLDRDFNGSDYEMLLGLDQEMGAQAAHSSISQALIDTIPKHKYKKQRKESCVATTESSSECTRDCPDVCTICLDALKEGENIRTLPCAHQYHDQCIITWLQQQGLSSDCPVCKMGVFQS